MVRLDDPWSNFLKKQFTKSLAPSLGAKRMWTKRKNDHVPKSECVNLFNLSPKRAALKKVQE